ncbi:MAG TPA: glycosyltransferase family 2 protein [Candidatus Tyrphobacter sp.]
MTTSVRGIESFTVVVPSFNEAATLRTNIEAVRAYLVGRTPLAKWTIVIVDDASADETPAIAAELAREDERIQVVRRASNGGVDAAIRSGIEMVESDAVVVLDADLSYAAPIVGALLEILTREEAEVALASAYAPGGEVRNVPGLRALLSRWANRFLAYAVNERVRTFTCIVRAYRTAALRELIARHPGGDMTHGILLEALRLGMSVCEVPACLEWAPQRRSRMGLRAIARRTGSVLSGALRQRPSLALVIPGLVPGILPLAILLAFLAHATPAQVGIVASATFFIQTASLFVLGFHSTNFALRTLLARRTDNERHVVRNNT